MQPTPGALPAPPPAHPGLTARLHQLAGTDQLVADAVASLDAGQPAPLSVGLLDTPVGSDYLPVANMIVLSVTYAGPALGAIADKLILYRLAARLHELAVDVGDPVALQAFNTRQGHLWRLANPAPAPAPPGICRFYQGTNRENFYSGPGSISAVGLDPGKAGGGIGCKRWEKHIVAAEYKDQGWHTVTLSFEVALSYARQHTEWAMGMKEHEPALRDVAECGGLVLSFDVPEASITGNDRWRQDKSGDSNNFQTLEVIPPGQIQVVEELAVPGPLTKVAPPPMVAQIPVAQRQATAAQQTGAKRRVYPTNFS
ncbi:hypothetical protein ABZ738_02965 [Micromonospora sp. NPDC047793]|uniref:hypothetical protein n=1 Tax=unclassified Micromonospora TaxID=2617518 RepID=UPI0010337E08|nr:hypothetical protein [Verrucosispora sp. SN26_14.1]TBL38345.1 hypothetical protein EYA84_09790 [Verrucosispora sp. SN26_14.1]